MNLLSLVRLLLFAGIVYIIYLLTIEFTTPLLLLSLVVLAAFLVCVNFYFRLKDHRILWEKLGWVNTNELGQLRNELNDFADGSGFLDSDNYLDDLDIFGKKSIFHVLNRTTTSHGTKTLTGLLRNSLLSVDSIKEQQQAIRALAPQTSQRQLLTAKGLLAGEKEGNLDSIQSWLETEPVLYRRKGLRIVINLLTVFNLFGIFYYLSSNNYTLLLAGVLVSWMITAFFTKKIDLEHELIARKQNILDQYAAILAVFNTVETVDSPLLQQVQTRTHKAHKAIRQLSKLSSFFDQRINVLVKTLLNAFCSYDLRCLAALERWKIDNKAAFPDWIEAVGNIECLNSLATFAFNNPDYIYPEPSPETGLFIEASRLSHPLIPAGSRVANDFSIGRSERLILISGSNMSGKTTFLRTIGVNLLLAQSGLPVCATAFSFTPMYLLTSLRISDSLQEQTSYFMAELKKLRSIVHRLQTGKPALVLIDEILRGTNSEDKTHGSELFIRKLIQYHCLSLFATHDLSLGQLEKELPDTISNYCFESVIEADNLHFNYQLQRGIARNRNASFLMKKMEII
jgi:DNA mismatch repair ATPase MutS